MVRALDMFSAPFIYSRALLGSENNLSETKLNQELEHDEQQRNIPGRLLALDLGERRVGVAVCDQTRLTVRPLPPLHRTSWKKLLHAVSRLIRDFDALALVIGLPLNLDGTEGPAALEARRRAHHFQLFLKIPVHLQDERLTSHEAEAQLRTAGFSEQEIREQIDSEAAAIILRDFISEKFPSNTEQTDSA
jgi:putative holliday junction resolvase